MASSKGPWESRTLDLIRPTVAFYHKCADRPAAGRARLDLIGATKGDRPFIIEVKQAPERVRTQDWLSWKPTADATILSPLQRVELIRAVEGGVVNVWVCVGIKNILFAFDFERMEANYGPENPWPLQAARHYFPWTGPKGWKGYTWNWI